ncbi:MAG: hypothetical protein ACRD6U_00360 [Nitrososphaeraceae archaeon]
MVLEEVIIKDGINYYIRYFASPSQYLNYLDDVEIMIQSFEIQNKTEKVRVTGQDVVYPEWRTNRH